MSLMVGYEDFNSGSHFNMIKHHEINESWIEKVLKGLIVKIFITLIMRTFHS